MADDESGFEKESESVEREGSVLVEKIAKVLQKIVQALNNTELDTDIQKIYSCKDIPKISFLDFLKRFQKFGDITATQLLASLIYTDRALKTRHFTQKSTVHK